jgi:lysophospholipid acyltransferase (LPLAT)-like uncharacterized protein
VARSLLGMLAGLLARVYLFTLRVRIVVDPGLDLADPRPWVLAFFHGEQFPLLAWPRRRRTVALVSLSRDGQLQAAALRQLGLAVVRGSSSRGGARGLAAVLRRLRAGDDAAFAVDGPRGPLHEAAPGARLAALRAGGVLVPMGSASRSGKTFHRAWDRYRLPYPFTRVTVHLGPPLEPARTSDRELGQAIARASALASRELHVLPSESPCATTSRSADAKFPST